MKYLFAFLPFFSPSFLLAQKEKQPYDIVKTGENTMLFLFDLPQTKTTGSFYNNIYLVDQRTDTSTLGFLDISNDYEMKIIIPGYPLRTQFSKLLNTIIDSSAGSNDLLLHIKRFNFSSITQQLSKSAYYYLRLRLYAKNNEEYRQLALLDTTVKINFGSIFKSNFRKRIFNSCSVTITNFLATNITKQTPVTAPYSIAEIMNIENIEKSNLALYTSDTLKDGMYWNFNSFKNQQPDTFSKYILRFKKEKLIAVQRENGYVNDFGDYVNGKANIPNETFYAIVNNGKAYISGSYGLYPLEKRDGDYYFTGKMDVSADMGEIATLNIASRLLFGSTGGLLTSLLTLGPGKSFFKMKIDYLTGAVIPIEKIND